MSRYEFFIPGVPKPGGSKRAFVIKGRAILTDASGKAGKDWRGDVKTFGRQAIPSPIMSGPVRLVIEFHMPRPKSHYRTGKHAGVLRPDAPLRHTSKPDATKLVRSLEDALTGIAWSDDAQIAVQQIAKVYTGTTPGALVVIETIEEVG